MPRSEEVLKKKVCSDRDVKGTQEPNEEGPGGQYCNSLKRKKERWTDRKKELDYNTKV